MKKANKILTYRILSDLKVTIQHIGGKITNSDIIEFAEQMRKHPDFNPGYDVIIDIRDADVALDEEFLKKYTEHIKSLDNFIAQRKVAFLTAEPEQYLSAYFSKLYAKHLPLQFNIFSTEESALEFIDCDQLDVKSYHQIKSELLKGS